MARRIDPALRLEEDAMAGSVVERRQEAQRQATIKEIQATKTPTADELAAMPPKVRERVRNEIKSRVTIELATLPDRIDTAIFNAGKSLEAHRSRISSKYCASRSLRVRSRSFSS
jgi:hypothetical protein